jgi:hypothetical protein
MRTCDFRAYSPVAPASADGNSTRSGEKKRSDGAQDNYALGFRFNPVGNICGSRRCYHTLPRDSAGAVKLIGDSTCC